MERKRLNLRGIGYVLIGAAFWGLVAGVLVSLLLERTDFAALRGPGG